MKRLFILLLVLAVASAFAFEKGTKTVGGFIGYNSYKYNSDADAVNTIAINPVGGYFFMDNICADLEVEYTNTNSSDWDEPETHFGFGIGGRYFYNYIYGGAAFMMMSYSPANVDLSYSANYLKFRGGYLFNIAENIYVDLGAHYMMGFGEYGGDGEGDNEESELQIGGGIDIFFP
ncbi:MAG: hypothetical protein JXB60_06600 [Candidatus Cloacimonetes bacterium]|nr:hypothetical protein [Candidatus Cloacimonadota bacterium]